MNDAQGFKQGAKVFKALGHPSRLAMVVALGKGEMCVCELTELVGAGASTVSKHLSVLRDAGILEDEKRGMQVYYRLRMTCITGFLACLGVVRKGRAGKEEVNPAQPAPDESRSPGTQTVRRTRSRKG